MRKWKVSALALGIIVFTVLSIGCASRNKQALQEAQTAIAEAEGANAGVKSPELLAQARKHLEQGEDYEFKFRYNQARREYEAAADAARLAKEQAGGGSAVVSEEARVESVPPAAPEESGAPAAPSPPEVIPLPPPKVSADTCISDLQACERKRASLLSALSRCEETGHVRTRVIREKCEEPMAAPSGPATRLMGTLMFEPPPAIVKDQDDYKIKVKYVTAQLDAVKGQAGDYRILLDIAGVEPAEVEVFSPTSDFTPLSDGVWSLSVKVPAGIKEAVKVRVAATIRNSATGKEQDLPEQTVTIPNAASCPACAPCPKMEIAKTPEAQAPKPDWIVRIVLLVVGIAAGLGAGFLVFKKGGKSGPTIRIGE